MRPLILALALLWASLLQAATYVVSVGIARYADPRFTPLSNTETDAKAMAEFYKKGTPNVITLTGRHASKSQILSSLKSQFARAREGDKIVFFFSGHGYSGGFCPFDMTGLGSGLSYSEVIEVMNSSKASEKIIFADACHSGGLRQGDTVKNPDAGNILFFLSSRGTESSIESPLAANGFFTKNLLRGLRGAADNNEDRQITARELFQYVSAKTGEDTGGRQHPVMWGSFPDDMVIVKYKKK